MKGFPVYCINLVERPDRKNHMHTQFAHLGIRPDHVRFLRFTRDERGGAYGCWDSHMQVWDDFWRRHPRRAYCLVLEDDCVVTPNTRAVVAHAASFIARHSHHVDILFLHNLCVPVQHPLNDGTITSGYGVTTHAYFVSRRYIGRVRSESGRLPDATGAHIDFAINMDRRRTIGGLLYTERAFYVETDGIMQLGEADGKSDNLLSVFDRVERVFCDDTCRQHKRSMDRMAQSRTWLTVEQQKDLFMAHVWFSQPCGEALGRLFRRVGTWWA